MPLPLLPRRSLLAGAAALAGCQPPPDAPRTPPAASSAAAAASAPPASPASPDDEMTPAEATAHKVNLAALQSLREYESTRSDQMELLLDNRLLARWQFSEHREQIELMSATKSIVSLVVGILLDHHLFQSLDQPVGDFFPEYRPKVTLLHLLNHTSGIESGKTTEAIYASDDFVRHALESPLVSGPGAKFFYNNSAVNLLAGLVKKAAGKPIDEVARERLFDPLGISDFTWVKDRAGNPHGMSGLRLRASDLAKIGQLVLDDGEWQGKRVVSKEWLLLSTRRPGQPYNPRCGLLWWMNIDFRIEIDDAQIDVMRKGGAPEDLLQGLKTMQGRAYSRPEFFSALGKALEGRGGVEAWHANTWKKGLPDGKLVDIGATSFYADGWLGQRLQIVPDRRLVAARLRFSSEDRRRQAESGASEKDLLNEHLQALFRA